MMPLCVPLCLLFPPPCLPPAPLPPSDSHFCSRNPFHANFHAAAYGMDLRVIQRNRTSQAIAAAETTAQPTSTPQFSFLFQRVSEHLFLFSRNNSRTFMFLPTPNNSQATKSARALLLRPPPVLLPPLLRPPLPSPTTTTTAMTASSSKRLTKRAMPQTVATRASTPRSPAPKSTGH